jgi:hypothetical protein
MKTLSIRNCHLGSISHHLRSAPSLTATALGFSSVLKDGSAGIALEYIIGEI